LSYSSHLTCRQAFSATQRGERLREREEKEEKVEAALSGESGKGVGAKYEDR
jgi:hypothetical protein